MAQPPPLMCFVAWDLPWRSRSVFAIFVPLWFTCFGLDSALGWLNKNEKRKCNGLVDGQQVASTVPSGNHGSL